MGGGVCIQHLDEELVSTYAHSEFLVFAVVTFYKTTVNTQLANPEPLLLGEIEGDVPVSFTFSSVDQYITLFHMCLKTSCVLCIVDALTLNSRPAAL